MIEHRYTEYAGEYLLKSWSQDGMTNTHGMTCDLPHWLAIIVNVAEIGQHIMTVGAPPPEKILWFITNDELDLIRFDNFSSGDEAAAGYQYSLELRHGQ